MENRALVIIDVQKGFINEYSKHVPERITQLLELNLFKEVILTKFINKDNSQFEKILHWRRLKDPEETGLAGNLNQSTTKIFVKNNYSAFTHEFIAYLKEKQISALYLVGIDTDVCVMKSAVDAFEKGFKPVVLGYYCASQAGKSYHESALKILERCIGKQNIITKDVQSEEDLQNV